MKQSKFARQFDREHLSKEGLEVYAHMVTHNSKTNSKNVISKCLI